MEDTGGVVDVVEGVGVGVGVDDGVVLGGVDEGVDEMLSIVEEMELGVIEVLLVIVELVDIVNCLSNTSFLGRLKQGLTCATATQRVWCWTQKRRCFVSGKSVGRAPGDRAASLSLVG
jgi:hypothetical protein